MTKEDVAAQVAVAVVDNSSGKAAREVPAVPVVFLVAAVAAEECSEGAED